MKKFLSAAAFLLVLLFCVNLLYQPLSWKETTGGYVSNVQQLHATGENLVDLAFVGSSHTFCTVNPAVLWNQRGIAAFDLSVSAMDKVSTKYFLQEFFKTQSPQVICLDLYALLFDRQLMQGNEYINYLALPPSLLSLACVLEYQPEDLASYVTRFPIIHTRYQELTAFDFVQYQPSVFGRGYYYDFTIQPNTTNLEAAATDEVTPLSEKNQTFLDAVIGLCQEHNCQLITAVMPFPITAEEQSIINGAKAYLTEQNIECLDMNYDADQYPIDYSSDFFESTHLNYYGSTKATLYLMDQLCARYDFADHRGDSAYFLWNENSFYDAYQVQRAALKKLDSVDPAAVLETVGTLPGFTAIVTIPAGVDINALDGALRQLLIQAGIPEGSLVAGTQWVLSGGQCLGTVSVEEAPLFIDLNSIHTLALNQDKAQSVELSGTLCEQRTDQLSVILYDNYEACILLHAPL